MDGRIRDIEWYKYFITPRHTAFKKPTSIRLFQHTKAREIHDKKDEPPPAIGWNSIELLNVFLWKAADFVPMRCRVGRFLIFKELSENHCRAPPIQNFHSKFLNLRRKCHVAEK